MLWFFERENQSLRLETRYDNETAEFVVMVQWPDGREQTERFTELETCRSWLAAFDNAVEAERWKPNGPLRPYTSVRAAPNTNDGVGARWIPGGECQWVRVSTTPWAFAAQPPPGDARHHAGRRAWRVRRPCGHAFAR